MSPQAQGQQVNRVDPPRMPEALAKAAESKVGIRETGGPNKGPDLSEFFAADNYKPNTADSGYAWCASFVCRVVQIAMASVGLQETRSFKRPRTPGAWDFENWCKGVDRTAMLRKPHKGDIRRGDIVVFKFSHIGVAVSDSHDNIVETVEGNTNKAGSREGDGVYRKTRRTDEIRSVIRFTV